MATIAQTESTELVSQFGEVEGLDWVVAASIVVVTIVASRIAFRLVAKAVGKTNAGDSVSRILGRLVSWLIVVIGLWFALNTIGVALGPLIGALGIAGLALAFAFQDILENLIAGLLMLLRRPITIGDEVVTNDYEGKVVDITLRAVEINTFDGERVYVPNAMVWKNPLTNTTKTPTRRTTLDVGVSYDADLDQVKELLEKTARTVEGVSPNPSPERWRTSSATTRSTSRCGSGTRPKLRRCGESATG